MNQYEYGQQRKKICPLKEAFSEGKEAGKVVAK
jgi:hypothetical protein